MNNQPITHSDSTIKMIIAKERWRQAHHSFNLAFVTTAACVFISFAGVGLVLLGKASYQFPKIVLQLVGVPLVN
ncbi:MULTISPECIES: TRADD-N-associated membrane domain-containing protein [unclassified Microcoleus]|uniref:TRADD-N-associated membrane domain-containing protein n=1 Tax=unclassified Microcoleus TaxID=2642155 RepID=UPI002FD0AB85